MYYVIVVCVIVYESLYTVPVGGFQVQVLSVADSEQLFGVRVICDFRMARTALNI